MSEARQREIERLTQRYVNAKRSGDNKSAQALIRASFKLMDRK